MKIDCELTRDEQDALCMLMGLAMGVAIFKNGNTELARYSVRIMNKLLAKSPDYQPYDENSYDPNEDFPFKPITPQ